MRLVFRFLFLTSALCASASMLASRALAQAYPIDAYAGAVANQRLGRSLAGGGDVDLDGQADFVIGGRDLALVISGATGDPIWTLESGTGLAGFGYAVALAGDMNGDGHAEILVGAPLLNGTDGTSSSAFVYSGATGTLLRAHDYANSDFSGRSVAGLGDTDFDGVADYAVCGPTGPGLVVYSGASGAQRFAVSVWSSTPIPEWPFHVPAPGRPIAGVKDVDGDGRADILVGRPNHASAIPTLYAGSASVQSGADGSTLFTISTETITPTFGSAVAALGDLDGDGRDELVVGGGGHWTGDPWKPGHAELVDGANGAVLHTFRGLHLDDRFGSSVAALGDVDGDGAPDLLVGAPNHGPGYAQIFSGLSRRTLLTIDGQRRGEQFGTATAGAGDLNDDGVPDVAIGAPHASIASFEHGAVRSLSYAGIPAGSAAFGTGCPGSTGVTPLALTGGGAATSAGNKAFRILLTHAKPATFVALQLGLSNTQSGATPLPFNLANFGMPACDELVSSDFLHATMSIAGGPNEGRATFPLPIPPEPALSGLTVYLQWFVSDPGFTILPGVVTNGLQLTVQ